jgi:hypothetical protein
LRCNKWSICYRSKSIHVHRYSGMDPEVGYGSGHTVGSGIDLGYYPAHGHSWLVPTSNS